jgi:hypothetical protein
MNWGSSLLLTLVKIINESRADLTPSLYDQLENFLDRPLKPKKAGRKPKNNK